jgi:hypothetical protein
MSVPPERSWLELATDRKFWFVMLVCVLVGTIAWLLGYD